MNLNLESGAQTKLNTKLAGWTIGVTALLEMFLMAHHPTSSSPETNQQFLDIIHVTSINSVVHGGLITLIVLTCLGLGVKSIDNTIY